MTDHRLADDCLTLEEAVTIFRVERATLRSTLSSQGLGPTAATAITGGQAHPPSSASVASTVPASGDGQAPLRRQPSPPSGLARYAVSAVAAPLSSNGYRSSERPTSLAAPTGP